eukprot:scaffold436962_cov23-Prasinocladus_malaysianus.AAC.1
MAPRHQIYRELLRTGNGRGQLESVLAVLTITFMNVVRLRRFFLQGSRAQAVDAHDLIPWVLLI